MGSLLQTTLSFCSYKTSLLFKLYTYTHLHQLSAASLLLVDSSYLCSQLASFLKSPVFLSVLVMLLLHALVLVVLGKALF